MEYFSVKRNIEKTHKDNVKIMNKLLYKIWNLEK